MKGVGFFVIFQFYSSVPIPTVNALKTDAALLGLWIKAMFPIMTWLVATLKKMDKKRRSLKSSHFFCFHEASWGSITARPSLTFQAPLCVHDISPTCKNG